jgi:hypothetical protein
MDRFQRQKCQTLNEEVSMHKIIFFFNLELSSYQPQNIRKAAKVGGVIIERSCSSDYRDVYLALIWEE